MSIPKVGNIFHSLVQVNLVHAGSSLEREAIRYRPTSANKEWRKSLISPTGSRALRVRTGFSSPLAEGRPRQTVITASRYQDTRVRVRAYTTYNSQPLWSPIISPERYLSLLRLDPHPSPLPTGE